MNSQAIESFLFKIPVLNTLLKLLKSIKPIGFQGLSVYHLLKLYIIGLSRGAIGNRASAIAYSFFMALFPFLLFIIVLIPYVPIDGFSHEFLAFLESFLPPQTSDFFHESIFKNMEERNQGGGLISSVFLVSIFLMANGVNAVFSGFNNSYHALLKRHFVRQYLFAVGIALILALLLMLTVAFQGYFSIYVIGTFEEFGVIQQRQISFWESLATYGFFLLMIYLATATLYYFGTKEASKGRFFTTGALLTTILVIINSYLFGIYIENFSKYNELYGAIGGLLILLVYLWLNANILLLGFELNVSIDHIRKTKN